MRRLQQLGHLEGLIAQTGQAHHHRRRAFAPIADGPDQRNAVIVLVLGRQQVGRDQVGGLQNLLGVAVVDLQDGGAPLRLHPHALEAELLGALAFVNALRIVIQQQEAVGGARRKAKVAST